MKLAASCNYVMTPFYDITIYYPDRKTRDFDKVGHVNQFREVANFVSRSYHRLLNGYKPPKTSRLGIHFTVNKDGEALPGTYFGSICSVMSYFDEDKYLELSVESRLLYILELLHASALKAATQFSWRLDIFQQAYQHLLDNNLVYVKEFPIKTNRKKSHWARAILKENLTHSSIYFEVSDQEKSTLFFAVNTRVSFAEFYCEKAKWFTNSEFGVSVPVDNRKVYYSLVLGTLLSK